VRLAGTEPVHDTWTLKAAKMFGVSPEEVTIVQRRLAKQRYYAEMYGNNPIDEYTTQPEDDAPPLFSYRDNGASPFMFLLARLFGTKVVACDSGFRTTMYLFRGCHYLTECKQVDCE